MSSSTPKHSVSAHACKDSLRREDFCRERETHFQVWLSIILQISPLWHESTHSTAFTVASACRFLELLSNTWSGTICYGSKKIYRVSSSFYGWLSERSLKTVTTYLLIAPFRGESGFFYVSGVASAVTRGAGETCSISERHILVLVYAQVEKPKACSYWAFL